jgi:hypothetical protein
VSGHSGALYTVRVKVKRADGYKAFGDLSEDGAYLGEVLRGYMKELTVESADENRHVRCHRTTVSADDLFVRVTHGESGMVGDIVDKHGVLKTRQGLTDSQNVMGAALFRLPRKASIGWLCVHVNHRRSCKGLLVDALTERFRQDFRDLKLEVKPCQLGSAFKQAVDDGRVEKVSLVRLDRASDRANPSLDKWAAKSRAPSPTRSGLDGLRLFVSKGLHGG